MNESKPHEFLTVPLGSIIETTDQLDEPGLVSICVGDEILLAFTRDIEERTERMDGRASDDMT